MIFGDIINEECEMAVICDKKIANLQKRYVYFEQISRTHVWDLHTLHTDIPYILIHTDLHTLLLWKDKINTFLNIFIDKILIQIALDNK